MHTRLFQDSTSAADLIAMINLLQRLRPPERRDDYPAAVDLHEMLSQPELQILTRLWFDDSTLVVFALVDAYNNLIWEIDPRYDLETEVIDWGMNCLHSMRIQGLTGASATLDANCLQEDTRRMEMLLRHGFAIQPGGSLHLRRSLEGEIPVPILPPGYSITNAAVLADAPHLVERIITLHRAAFGTNHMTLQERKGIMSAPGYDPRLDLFILAGDTRLAGYCTCSYEAGIPSVGYTDPIAVHPDFQRLGLGRALLCEGMRLLSAHGVQEARLGTSSSNTAMLALAQAVGFEVYETGLWLSKVV
jgi:mycothiol synthase